MSLNNLLPVQALTTMDTEEVIHKCKAITIREEDEAKITLEVNLKNKKEQMMAGCLVGKVLLTNRVNKDGLKAELQQV